MSKSAIAALTEAQNIIAKSGVTVNLVGYIADKNVRKNWRNANALAALIINSAANAFQCENSETLVENQAWFDTMTDAVTAYIDSNLDQWNQKEAASLNLVISLELVRLEGMVNANMNFEAGVAAATAKKLVKSASCAQLLSDATGFPVDYCAAELEAEEGDYFAVLARLRATVETAHEEALAIDKAYSAQLGFYSHTAGWQHMIVTWAHEDALKQDADYQAAIGVVADNLSLPVWDGASDTVKAEVIKHQRAQAEEGTGTIDSVVNNHVTIQQHASHPETLQLFWGTLTAYQKEFLMALAHDDALEMNAKLAELSRFRLPTPTQEEREARYFRSLTDVELAYGIESDLVPVSRRPLYVAEAERRQANLSEAKTAALNELVSGCSLEQAQARFVSRLTAKQLAEALLDTDFPAERRAAYAAELQRRKGDRLSFDDGVLGAIISNLASDLLSEALNSHTTKPEERPLYENEIKRRQSGFSSRAVIWRKN